MSKGRKGGSDDYEVGYKKPPTHTRFKPGNQAASTSDKPRRRKSLTLDQMLARVLKQSRSVRLPDGRTERRANLELIAQKLVAMALSNEPRQVRVAINAIREVNPLLDDPASKSLKVEFVNPTNWDEIERLSKKKKE
ncbi:MAG: hypothetical protein J0I47_15545 [Sphingomonas sp.]|uniref:hypothetical protein n=1 Tax=Sphingomonas sp. TaxID=28214 RepID=UPI001AD538F5|nr:hypothetical protein [Sphingomonas sp.]MBN8809632.1 hypothetical protein [Sphingomonas sp.]